MTRAEEAAVDLVERVAEKLRANNIEATVVDTGAEAREAVLRIIPEGSEVHTAKSKTLADIGLTEILNNSGRYDAIRPKYLAMDRKTQGREIRKLQVAPDFMVGSVAAITEEGLIVAASATGSQIAPYVAGAGRVIFVIGSQKIVRDLDTALARIRKVAFPYENAKIRESMGVDTKLEKVLLMFGEWLPGRTTVVLVREPVGV